MCRGKVALPHGAGSGEEADRKGAGAAEGGSSSRGRFTSPFLGTYYFNHSFMRVDEATLREYVRKQVEYYFSEENLQRDFFLRRKVCPPPPRGRKDGSRRRQVGSTDVGGREGRNEKESNREAEKENGS